MGNSSSICADRKKRGYFENNSEPIYPSTNTSHISSIDDSKLRHNSSEFYKTTIPINHGYECSHLIATTVVTKPTSILSSSSTSSASSALTKTTVLNNRGAACCCTTNSTNNRCRSSFQRICEHNLCECSRRNNDCENMNCSNNKSSQLRSNENLYNSNNVDNEEQQQQQQRQQQQQQQHQHQRTQTVEYELSNGIAQLSKSKNSVHNKDISIKSSCNNLIETNKLFCLNCIDKNINNIHNNNKFICANQLEMSSTIARDRLGYWNNGDNDVPGNLSGLDRLNKKRYTKGLAFTVKERQLLGIQGLLPAVVKSEDEQVAHCMILLDRLENDLDKYIYLNGLVERNERLFYKLLSANVAKLMPYVYTPTVGLGCQKFSLIFQHCKGLFITINDKGHVYDVLKNWPETDIRAIVVTDGERILGLGDLGANGMGIPCGKLSLYTALAGIKPYQCLPITLDVGTNTQSILDDEIYVGLRHKRITGQLYDEFIDEFMKAVVKRFGQNCLIQFEDFGNANAFRLLEKYRHTYCTFNDDIQGTASVALAGLLASTRLTNTKLKDHTILFQGAGEAALGIAKLCQMALECEGLSPEDAKKHIWLVDSKGLIIKDRPKGGLTEHKMHFAHEHDPVDTLKESVEKLKPTALIGAAAIGGAFTTDIITLMAENNEIPIIFALSNPTSKAECTAEQAYTNTKGKCIFASGSPFDPVEYNGKTFTPGQGNNSYVFPGIALGVLCAGMLTVPEDVFLLSAKTLADLCTEEDLQNGSIYPPPKLITQCSVLIAEKIMEYAFEKGMATLHPEPEDKIAFIKSQMYNLDYPEVFPKMYAKHDE